MPFDIYLRWVEAGTMLELGWKGSCAALALLGGSKWSIFLGATS